LFLFCFGRDINDNPPVFVSPETNEIRHVLSNDHSKRVDPSNPSFQFITEIKIDDRDLDNNSLVILTISNSELFSIGLNNSLWLKNSSITPGTYEIELQAKNHRFLTKKRLQILIYKYNPLSLNLFNNMSKTLRKTPTVLILILIFLLISFFSLIIIYYTYCWKKTVKQNLYGSRLIVNDEEKCSQKKILHGVLPSNEKNDYAVWTKQRKVCLYLECIIVGVCISTRPFVY